jgi:hypothetical protein
MAIILSAIAFAVLFFLISRDVFGFNKKKK